MNSSQQVDQLGHLLLSSINTSQDIRQEANNQLDSLTKNNFDFLLLELSKKQSNISEPTHIRQLCATIIKNKILTFPEKWWSLNSQSRSQIKTNILSTLIDQDINIKKAAGLCISGICKIEFKMGQWFDIFDTLINAAQNQDVNVEITALIILGYIYEDIDVGTITEEIINKLMNMYYSLLSNKYNESLLVFNCLKSIKCLIPFLDKFLSNYNNKKIFLDLIQSYVINQNENIRQIAISSFLDLVKLFYKYLDDYSDNLVGSLLKIIENDPSNQNKIYAIEVFSTLGDKEVENMNIKGYKQYDFKILNKFRIIIGNTLLKNILTNNFDTDEYTISKACSYLINSMCQCCDFDFTELMIDYYNKNIESNDAIIKFSALNVFNSVLYTNEKKKIYNLVLNSLAMLSGFLLEKQTINSVKKLIAKIMKSIVKNFGEYITLDKNIFYKFMILFLNLIKSLPPEVLVIILDCIHFLVKHIQTKDYNPTNYLSPHAQNFYEILLELSQKTEFFNPNCNIPMNALFSLGVIGQYSANDIHILSCNYFESLVQMFYNTLNVSYFPNNQMRLSYQEYICVTLSSFLMNRRANDKDVRKLFDYTIQSFHQRQELYEEGISLIAQIAAFLKNGFIHLMLKFNDFLKVGLNSLDKPSICFSSVLCLSGVITALDYEFNDFVEDYLKIILNILANEKVERDVKPICFNILSDLFISCKNKAFLFMLEIMKYLGGAMENSKIDLSRENIDSDTVLFYQKLREHILETFQCIFLAVIEIEKVREFWEYAKHISGYIIFLLREGRTLTEEIQVSAIALAADFCQVYQENMKSFLDITLIEGMIHLIEIDENILKNKNKEEFLKYVKNAIFKSCVDL